jgi:ArsR family metal-binding transcriptional regulator
LPYLAALLPQSGYNHDARILTLVKEGRLLTVYAQAVTLAKAVDEDDARAVLEWLRGRLNEAWAHRGELRPVLERRRAPTLLDVYRLLPGGNCRRCGEATCLALAGRLIFGEAKLGDCPRLAEGEYTRLMMPFQYSRLVQSIGVFPHPSIPRASMLDLAYARGLHVSVPQPARYRSPALKPASAWPRW